MSPDPAGDLERLRAIALALPQAAEKVSHGQPVFFIEKGKLFAQYWHDHHHDGASAVMVKLSGIEEQRMLIAIDPELYYRPAYIGASGWIAIRTDVDATDWDLIAGKVEASWQTVAPARLLRTP
ncbi:MmcQ/YjbR family DNA-binding protein [Sphingomonas bacterium]|uniref:MmcQ/YjbR family DNA-binding protein n=1 Tax=Sphingomonas bacterium TaxID=1895847 RepID=UPI0034A041CB